MSQESLLFESHLAQTTPFPIGLKIKSASGIYINTSDDRQFIDMISGVGVNALGHGNKEVLTAIKKQVEKHLHVMVYGEFVQEAQIDAARELTAVLPKELDTVYFVNSGTEANEAALKLAKRVTVRHKIISFEGAYHGSTHGSLSVSGNETKKASFRPLLPEIEFIRLNNNEDLNRIDSTVACVILETIQGDAGVRIPTPQFMHALRAKCESEGALLILDEIQCGIGRTGKMFAFEHYGIKPDILALGKALGAGMPIGALVANHKLMRQFTFDPMLGHITTFGGHPVACAAAAAGLRYMSNKDLVSKVQRKGNYIFKRINVLPGVVEVRQMGLFIAVDLGSEARVSKVVGICMEMGLLLFRFLSCPSSFRIAPPLVINDVELRQACDIIELAIREASLMTE